MKTAVQPPVSEWPATSQQHPLDGPPSEAEAAAADRHERTHRQSSQEHVTGLDGWRRFRAANFRSAAESWTGHAAWLRANGGSREDIAVADFHAQRFGRQAEVYGPVAS